jgi:hypothetical protein
MSVCSDMFEKTARCMQKDAEVWLGSGAWLATRPLIRPEMRLQLHERIRYCSCILGAGRPGLGGYITVKYLTNLEKSL